MSDDELRRACEALVDSIDAIDSMKRHQFERRVGLALAFAKQQRAAVLDEVLDYQRMRICIADESRCTEVLAGNIVKEAIENGAIAELRGLETWCREQRAKELGA